AIKSALSSKMQNNEILVLDALAFEAPRTKDMVKVLGSLNVNGKALIVTGDYDSAVALSARNIPGVKFVSAEGINVLDVLHHDNLLMTQDAVAKVEEVLA
ncbi:MAG TPA: 50S ribosomal protein L4, partial [Paenibacillaceae bacterium]|nr:50S ribosomal protein L4 [Paenibacillaceae bacterium]